MSDNFNPDGFLLFPATLFVPPAVDWNQVEALYRQVFEQSRAAFRPAITERLFAVCMN
jgi:hypothetical protein